MLKSSYYIEEIKRASDQLADLISFAKESPGKILTLAELSARPNGAKVHHIAMLSVLKLVQHMCLENDFPDVTCLVVKADGTPANGAWVDDWDNMRDEVKRFQWKRDRVAFVNLPIQII